LAAALATAVFVAAPDARAHDFWIQPDAFAVPIGGVTSMTVWVGHGTFRQVSLIPPDRVTRFFSAGRDGTVERRADLRLGTADARTPLRFPRPGLQVLGFETNGAYSELPGLRFTDYLRAEGLTLALDLRARTHAADAPGREVYRRRAKALVLAGVASAADDAVAVRPLGFSLEIVPERNPYAVGFDGQLPVRVLYDGRPLAGATVKLNNLDFDARPIETHLTDAAGEAIFRLPRIGAWQLNVIWTKPIAGDGKADFETTFSSLTLGFPRGQAAPRRPS
jgi:uncharacterized GH25 family protein